MIQMPAVIPAPSQEFSLGNEPNAIRTTMESGAVRQRRTSLISRYKASIKWEMLDEEYNLFLQFLEIEADGGVAWFETPLCTVSGISQHKIRLVNGVFHSSYQAWGGWVVTAEADVEKLAILNINDYWLVKDDGSLLSTTIDTMERAVNVDLPQAFSIY